MEFENSLQWITEFWKNNQALVEQIQKTGQGAADDIKKLADALQENQQQGTQLGAALSTGFQVAPDDKTKQAQSNLIKRIQDLNEQIEQFRDEPEITAPMLSQRSDLYVALADTFDQVVSQFVVFGPDEVKEINGLLNQAALDAASRQKWADVLNATVALTEMALQVAVKVAAA
jgi:hypothetical protein